MPSPQWLDTELITEADVAAEELKAEDEAMLREELLSVWFALLDKDDELKRDEEDGERMVLEKLVAELKSVCCDELNEDDEEHDEDDEVGLDECEVEQQHAGEAHVAAVAAQYPPITAHACVERHVVPVAQEDCCDLLEELCELAFDDEDEHKDDEL